MEPPVLWCPSGEGRLVRNDSNGVHYTCDVCHGFAISIWLLDELLVEGAGATLWRASEGAATDGSPCPSCRHPMAEVDPVQICRSCELVWVSRVASTHLPVSPALAPTGAGAPGPTHCPHCGAVYQDTAGGRCRYCRAEITPAEVAVSAPEVARKTADANIAPRRPDRRDDWVADYMDREGHM